MLHNLQYVRRFILSHLCVPDVCFRTFCPNLAQWVRQNSRMMCCIPYTIAGVRPFLFYAILVRSGSNNWQRFSNFRQVFQFSLLILANAFVKFYVWCVAYQSVLDVPLLSCMRSGSRIAKILVIFGKCLNSSANLKVKFDVWCVAHAKQFYLCTFMRPWYDLC